MRIRFERDNRVRSAPFLLNDIVYVIFISVWFDASYTDVIMLLAVKGVLLTALYYIYFKVPVVAESEEESINNRPIIGVLSQELSPFLNIKYPHNYTSYIAASYVKDIEASGARVVPIMIGRDRSYYMNLMSKINGVLLPGGATYFNQSNGYADAGAHILSIAKQFNEEGSYFPIFGTCLGFELLIILASGRGKDENRVKCYSFQNLNLHFTENYRRSKMFQGAPDDIIYILMKQNVTVNAHQYCIVDKNLKNFFLTEEWLPTSHSEDDSGIIFIASIEHKRYPFYGVQFHPEKSAFEWKSSKYFAHSQNAVKANRYFTDFFVSECRRNNHEFSNEKEENRYLIYNYEPLFTGRHGSIHQQCYFFEPRGNQIDPDDSETGDSKYSVTKST